MTDTDIARKECCNCVAGRCLRTEAGCNPDGCGYYDTVVRRAVEAQVRAWAGHHRARR